MEKCSVYPRNKANFVSLIGFLQSLLIPDKILEELTMDFIEGLPKSKGYDVILVVVDRVSESAHFIALKHPIQLRK